MTVCDTLVPRTFPPVAMLLLADLAAELPVAVRLQRLVSSLRVYFRCGAVALLRLDHGVLRPVATDGLTADALGRRYAVADHPRLAAILEQGGVTCFDHDSAWPDPYDGLLKERAGEPLPVHDCMGMPLNVEGERWGVVTLDALDVNTFDAAARAGLREMAGVIEAAVRVTRLETETRALRLSGSAPQGSSAPRQGLEILGRSEAMTTLLHELDVVADTELPVLLLGETGVGKELFAHRLHQRSRRAGKALVHVNCAALPETLAESELFGHVRGAFSGAVGERAGRVEAAEGGTLFLDEVGELPMSVQAKLLRTLQNGEIQRLGADRPSRVDVRVIAATNRNLRERVKDGTFRADLYHRLSVYPIPIPPLRERDDDVLLLAGRFLELNRARLGLRSLRLSEAAHAVLRGYDWPGNVRELEHVISRAALKAVSRGASRHEIVSLAPELLDLRVAGGQGGGGAFDADRSSPVESCEDEVPVASLKDVVLISQRRAIEAALARHGNNWACAARALEVDASNLHKLAKRLGMKGCAHSPPNSAAIPRCPPDHPTA